MLSTLLPSKLPSWRSLLYVPANVDRFVARACVCAADAIQLDLEDGVAATEKHAAREAVPAAAARLAGAGKPVIIRINRPLDLAVRDIEASVGTNVVALSLPKVESADHVRLLSELIGHVEAQKGMMVGATRLILAIETPTAWLDMAAIARADPRVVAMLLGGEDFSAAVGMTATAEHFAGPKQTLVIAAAAAGILPLGLIGSLANFHDIDDFRAMVTRSRAFGFRGASCIHPDQIAPLNEGFSPTFQEIVTARRIVEAFESALADGRGSIAVDGAMVDRPVAERARAILAYEQLN